MTTSSAIQKTFLQSPFFAVVGASKDRNKFGTKVWQFQISPGRYGSEIRNHRFSTGTKLAASK